MRDLLPRFQGGLMRWRESLAVGIITALATMAAAIVLQLLT